MGVSLGLLMLPLMKYAGLKVIPSTLGVVLGMVFSVATGTFFG